MRFAGPDSRTRPCDDELGARATNAERRATNDELADDPASSSLVRAQPSFRVRCSELVVQRLHQRLDSVIPPSPVRRRSVGPPLPIAPRRSFRSSPVARRPKSLASMPPSPVCASTCALKLAGSVTWMPPSPVVSSQSAAGVRPGRRHVHAHRAVAGMRDEAARLPLDGDRTVARVDLQVAADVVGGDRAVAGIEPDVSLDVAGGNAAVTRPRVDAAGDPGDRIEPSPLVALRSVVRGTLTTKRTDRPWWKPTCTPTSPPSGFTALTTIRLPFCSAVTLSASASACVSARRSIVIATSGLSQEVTSMDPSKVFSSTSALPDDRKRLVLFVDVLLGVQVDRAGGAAGNSERQDGGAGADECAWRVLSLRSRSGVTTNSIDGGFRRRSGHDDHGPERCPRIIGGGAARRPDPDLEAVGPGIGIGRRPSEIR